MAQKCHRLAATLAIVWVMFQFCNAEAATIVVTNLASAGPGTLRSALTNAQNGDTITFAVTGIITNTVLGGLTISNNISIIGPGPSLLCLTGTNICRGFKITNGVTASISGLTFTNFFGWDIGSDPYGADGGAIFNSGSLLLSNCLFTACHNIKGGQGRPGFLGGNGGSGGAIFNGGTLQVVNCQFLNNSAGNGGNGGNGSVATSMAGGNGGVGGNGGAIYDAGTAGSFLNCTFGWNASGYGGAGGAGNNGASSGNGADGGIGSAVFSLGGATFVNCTFFGNTNGAGGAGGTGNAGSGSAGGNGGNANGGTLYCTGAVQLIACTFAGDTAGKGGNGGGGGAGPNNTFGGSGGKGGNGGSGGIGGNGGGIVGPSANSSFTLRNVLIAQNLAGSGGSAGGGGAGGSGTPSGSNGTGGNNGAAGTGPDLYGSFISQGHNLIGLRTSNTGFTNLLLGDIVGTNTAINAKVGSLTNNSGWAWTCALQNGSPALDAGDDTLTGNPLNLTNDARGYPRQSGSHVDIGAYENQYATTPVTFNPALTSGSLQLVITNTPGAYFSVLASSSLTTPLTSWTVLGVMSETSPGRFVWTDAAYTSSSLRFFRLRNP